VNFSARQVWRVRRALNEAVTVHASRTATVRLTVSRKRGFAARNAELPLHVTCTNAPSATFSRKGMMLVLTSK
jgi:hypothetical protein